MKKQTILLLAAGVLALASCGDGGKKEQENAQAKVDSMANAMKLQATKDSMTAVMNAEKAKTDSLANAMKAEEEKKAAETKHSSKGHAATKGGDKKAETAPAPAPTPSTQDSKFNNRGGNKSTPAPADQKAQDDKFKNRGK